MPEIILPEELTRLKSSSLKSLHGQEAEDTKSVTLGIHNLSFDIPVQLFIHKGSSSSAIHSTTIGPGRYHTK